MSRSEMERLRNNIADKPNLLAEIDSLEDSLEAWLHWTASRGYQLSTAEVEELRASHGAELSDEELEQAAGGWDGENPPPPPGGGGATGGDPGG